MASSKADSHSHHQREESPKSHKVLSPRQAWPESDNDVPPVDGIRPVLTELRNDAQSFSKTARLFSDKVVKYIEDIEKRIRELEHEIHVQNTRSGRDTEFKEKIAKLTQQYTLELYEQQQKVTNAEKEMAALKETIERDRLEGGNELKEKLEKRNRQIEQIHKKYEELKTQLSSLKLDERRNSQGIERELRAKLERREKQVKNLSEECEDLKTRLSKVISSKLTDGNPNIADLSDGNRPTKLGERYMELYDNQWTDAFETIQKYKKRKGSYLTDDELEKEAISILLQVLKGIWQFCKDEIHEQDIHVKEAILRTKNSSQSLPDEFLKTLKSTKKKLAVHTADAVSKNVIARKQKVNDFPTSEIEPYVKECVTLCWLMVNQDPPVVFDLKAMPDDEFDARKYREYMKRGSHIDFVIWPPMLLHEEGSVLAKGVAQGKQRFGSATKASPDFVDNRKHRSPELQRQDKHNKLRQVTITNYNDFGDMEMRNDRDQHTYARKSPTETKRGYTQTTMTADYEGNRKESNIEKRKASYYHNDGGLETGSSAYRQASASKGTGYNEDRYGGTRNNTYRQTVATLRSQTGGHGSDAQSTTTLDNQRPQKGRNVETSEGFEYRNFGGVETSTTAYRRQESASKRYQSDVKRWSTQETVTPVSKTPAQRSETIRNIMYTVHGGYTSTMPTDAEYDRYLYYLDKGWSGELIRGVLSSPVYERCKYLEQIIVSYA